MVEVVIGEFPSKNDDIIRVSQIKTDEGVTRDLDIRVFYRDHGEYKPSKKGIRCPIENCEKLISLIKEAKG